MSSMCWVLTIILALLCFLIISLFNSLIMKRNRVKNAWSDVDVQLKRRYDLIPNLVEVVKGYKNYESSVLEKVTLARVGALGAQNGNLLARAAAENILSGALKTFFAVAENYPNLKASANFQQLQNQLSSIEEDIQSARRYYNAAVREMNNATQIFPSNIFAKLFNFKQEEFFEANKRERDNTDVSFK